MQNIRSKKKVIIISVIAILSIIALIVYASIMSTRPKDDYLNISNLDTYTNGKPSDRDTLNYIKETLFKTVNLNTNPPVTSNSVDDVMIREGTFSQEANGDESLYKITFIVDIESLKQSYSVAYSWSMDDDDRFNHDQDERGVSVLCLPVDKLIYGDFDCKDLFTEEESFIDPIFQYLPHTTLDYKVTFDPIAEEKTLVITIMTSAADERSDPEAAISAYRSSALQWLDSLEDIDPSDYKIEWVYQRASIY